MKQTENCGDFVGRNFPVLIASCGVVSPSGAVKFTCVGLFFIVSFSNDGRILTFMQGSRTKGLFRQEIRC